MPKQKKIEYPKSSTLCVRLIFLCVICKAEYACVVYVRLEVHVC